MNLKPTIEAFNKCKSSMERNPNTLAVHKELLFTDYLTDNSDKLARMIAELARCNEEVSTPSFIAQVCERMPKLECSKDWNLFDKHVAKKVAAQLLLNIYLDNDILHKRVEPVSTSTDGKPKFVPRVHVQLGGTVPPKDKYRGIEFKPGVVNQKYIGPIRLNGDAKQLLRRVASNPFKLSSIVTKELLAKSYSLSKSFNYQEDSLSKRFNKTKMYEDNAEFIMSLKGEQFYMPMKYDSRYRMYYELQLDGIRPQGKLWETCMIDCAVPRVITESGYKHIKHLIFVLRHGRTTFNVANKLFKDSDYYWAKEQNPLDDALVFDGTKGPEKEFGERVLLNKLADAMDMYTCGVPCPYMFGKDLTNSGLIMAGVSFGSTEMVEAGNIAGNPDEVVDSHTVFGDGYGLDISRDEVKSIHTALLHGSTNRTIAKMLDVEESVVAEGNLKAYGPCVENIADIADFGVGLVDNHCSKLEWKTPDGWKAYHEAKLTHVPFDIYAACADTKSGFSHTTVVGESPIHFLPDGSAAFGSGYGAGKYSKDGVEVKVRGLYANITHSLDSFVLRKVCARLLDAGSTFMLKHDDYMVHPNDFDMVGEAAVEALQELSNTNYYDRALEDIASSRGCDYVPDLASGSWDKEIDTSCRFLMP